MAEELGIIKIEVEGRGAVGGAGTTSRPPVGSGPPQTTQPPRPPEPGDSNFIGPLKATAGVSGAGKWQALWRQIGPRISGLLPGGSATAGLVGDVGGLAAGATGVAAVGATVGVAVAGIALLGVAAVGTVKALNAFQRSTIELAAFIGNFDPRIAQANANERIAEVNRRLAASAAAGNFAAFGLGADTALRDALAGLTNTLAPIKAYLGGTFTYVLAALTAAIDEAIQSLGRLLSGIGVTIRSAVEAVLTGLMSLVLPGSAAEAIVVGILNNMDAKLANIESNTRPRDLRRANSWAIAEARSFGARNW